MGNNIINKLKYKESVVKVLYKYGVIKAAIKFCECRRTIYRWRKNTSRCSVRAKEMYEPRITRNGRKEYNNFPMRPLGWLSSNEFIKQYKSQEESLIIV